MRSLNAIQKDWDAASQKLNEEMERITKEHSKLNIQWKEMTDIYNARIHELCKERDLVTYGE
jgi:hypothetical protein